MKPDATLTEAEVTQLYQGELWDKPIHAPRRMVQERRLKGLLRAERRLQKIKDYLEAAAEWDRTDETEAE